MTDAFNRSIRAAVGRSTAPASARPIGDVGIGKGDAARPRRRDAAPGMNSAIRGAWLERRERRAELEADAEELFRG